MASERECLAVIEVLGEYAYRGGAWTSVPTMIKSALIRAGADEATADAVRTRVRDRIAAVPAVDPLQESRR
jgi:hypothetical protein